MMVLSNQLSDYVAKERVVDIIQTVFPGRVWEELHKDLDDLAREAVPIIIERVEAFQDKLYIPRLDEVFEQNFIPADLGPFISGVLDALLPDWNIVQKTVVYWIYLLETTTKAQKAYLKRQQEKHADLMRSEGKEDSLSTPHPDLN